MSGHRAAGQREPRAGDTEAPAGRVRRFAVFELDLDAGQLRKSGAPVRLQPQPFAILALLTARPGEVVTREEMCRELWPEGHVVDVEQSLNFCIRQIRLALDDSAHAPRFVETLPRRGYRWVGGPTDDDSARAESDDRAPGDLEDAPGRVDPSSAYRADPAQGRTWRWVAGASALAALLVVSVFFMRRPEPPGPARFDRLTFRSGFLTAARFAPDGRAIYAASWDGRPIALYESRKDSYDARSLERGAVRLAGFPAAGEVAFIQNGRLARAPLAGGPPRMVARGVRSADWSPDEADFALVRVVPGGHQVEYPVGRVLARGAGMGDLRLSPDGRHLAVARHPTLGDDRGFVEILDRQGRAVATSETFGSLEGLAWAPGGGEAWFTAVGVGVKNSLQALDLEGAERSLLQTIGRLVLHDVAPDGRLLVSRSALRAEILFQRAGQPGVVDLSWLDVSGAAALSPGGDTILFYEGGEGGGPDYTAFTRSTDGGSLPMRLGEGRALDLSPDGRWALVVPVTRPERLVLLPTGPGEARTLQGPGGMVAHDAGGWLPDGRTLFITGRDADGRRATWLVDEEGGALERLPLPDGRFLTRSTFSPDGTEFVARCPPPDPQPCLYPRAEGSPRPVPGAEAGWEAIRWGPRGRIYFRDRPGVGAAPSLRRVDPATGEVEVLARLAPADPSGVLTVYRVLVTPDGGAWAYNVIRRQSDLFIATLGL